MTIARTREQRIRRIVFGSLLALLLGSLFVWLLIGLRALILPVLIGALLAYICAPAVNALRQRGLGHGPAVLLLFGSVLGGFALLIMLGKSTIPDERGALELKIRARYKLDERYSQVMGLEGDAPRGNLLHDLVGRDTDPIVWQIDEHLRLTLEERALLERVDLGLVPGAEPLAPRYRRYHLENIERDRRAGAAARAADKREEGARPSAESPLAAIMAALSLWLVMPFVFLFLLIDDGQIKKWLIRLVPNRYFEMALTCIDNVDRAIGSYLRGTMLECGLVGLTFTVGLALIGVDPRFAMLIGVIAGVANAIPFLGPVIGLVVGLAYALLAEDVQPLLPFLDERHLVLGVVATVALTQLLDNAIYQPVVLGTAVSLHPLAVILGVMGGSILFGFFGMLFAVPAIVVFKEVLVTLVRQARAYYLV